MAKTQNPKKDEPVVMGLPVHVKVFGSWAMVLKIVKYGNGTVYYVTSIGQYKREDIETEAEYVERTGG
jgi:hypothetical protein